MREVELEVECFSDLVVLRNLLARLGGEGVHLVSDGQQALADLLANGLCRSPR